MLKSPQFCRQGDCLLDLKLQFVSQVRHQNKIQKVFLRRFPFNRFLAKTLRVIKTAMKKQYLFVASFTKHLNSFENKIQLSCVGRQANVLQKRAKVLINESGGWVSICIYTGFIRTLLSKSWLFSISFFAISKV